MVEICKNECVHDTWENDWYTCPECGYDCIDIDHNYCPACGTPIRILKEEQVHD